MLATQERRRSVSVRHISVSRDGAEMEGKVIHAEHLGADTILYVETEAAGLITVRLFGEHHYNEGDMIFITLMCKTSVRCEQQKRSAEPNIS